MSPRMQPRNEKFFTLFSKASSNVVESAAILMEFAAAPHERWATLAKRMHDSEHAGDDTTQVVDPEQGGCQDEGAAVDGSMLVVSGREPAPVFEAVESSLDDERSKRGEIRITELTRPPTGKRAKPAEASKMMRVRRRAR